MSLPHTNIESHILSEGQRIVVGIDEAGRGPLAGPVVAAAAWIDPKRLDADFPLRTYIRDSKSISPQRRDAVFEFLEQEEGIVYEVAEVSHAIIDRINILQATLLAMRLAVEGLLEKIGDGTPAVLLVDGNQKIRRLSYEQHLFPKGDRDIFSIALASICAKVYRDRVMNQYHQQFPVYGFDQHRGYGTALHMKRLQEHGPCDIHRKSFGPIKRIT